MTREELREAVLEEWARLHHNASYSRSYPSFQNEYEYSLFSDCLGNHVSESIDYLRDILKEKYGVSLTFYQYGRQGATIAPHEWMAAAPCNDFGGLRDNVLSDEEGLDGYNADRRILTVLQEINRYCRAEAASIPEWWQDMKEANEYQADIEAHEGKKPVQVTVWR